MPILEALIFRVISYYPALINSIFNFFVLGFKKGQKSLGVKIVYYSIEGDCQDTFISLRDESLSEGNLTIFFMVKNEPEIWVYSLPLFDTFRGVWLN